jgi:hypothetical protein
LRFFFLQVLEATLTAGMKHCKHLEVVSIPSTSKSETSSTCETAQLVVEVLMRCCPASVTQVIDTGPQFEIYKR